MSSERVQGVVKWFSNQKGYGFITPNDSGDDHDVFVHQSAILSEGYRTLIEGWIVEFQIVTDENGQVRADHVTAPGGGPCTGPKRPRRPRKDDEIKKNKPKQEWWHHALDPSVKQTMMDQKSIRMSSGTVDVSTQGYRIKLGTLGYTSLAHQDCILAEGTFSSDEHGIVTFDWQRALEFANDEWKPCSTKSLIASLDLASDEVGAVGTDETAETLWGDGPTDPKEALENNGFQMRRVVLTAKGTRGGGGGSKTEG